MAPTSTSSVSNVVSPITTPKSVDNTSDPNQPAHWFELQLNGKTLKYTVQIIGTQRQLASGYVLYIGMHGGGAGSVQDNNGIWKDAAERFFHDPVLAYHTDRYDPRPAAVLVCPRGISSGQPPVDTWDFQFQNESCALLEMMITNLIQKTPPELTVWPQLGQNPTLDPQRTFFANPNRVFLWGFSSGGDGVFQISTRIPNRFAGVVAAAGHPNWASYANLANLPTLLEVGENDYYDNGAMSFQRAQVYVQAMKDIDQQRALVPSQYYTQCYPSMTYVVKEGDHNSWSQPDRIDTGQYRLRTDASNIARWLAKFPTPQTKVPIDRVGIDYDPWNFNPLRWMDPTVRTPVPEYVVWNLGWQPQVTLGTYPRFHYWQCLRRAPPSDAPLQKASYSVTDKGVSLRIYSPPNLYMGYLIDNRALGRSLSVYLGNDIVPIWTGHVVSFPDIVSDTAKARGDPYLTFAAMIILYQPSPSTWTATAVPYFERDSSASTTPAKVTTTIQAVL